MHFQQRSFSIIQNVRLKCFGEEVVLSAPRRNRRLTLLGGQTGFRQVFYLTTFYFSHICPCLWCFSSILKYFWMIKTKFTGDSWFFCTKKIIIYDQGFVMFFFNNFCLDFNKCSLNHLVRRVRILILCFAINGYYHPCVCI